MDGLLMKYFVLNPNKDDEYGNASREAMLAYAKSIRRRNPDLAKDLRAWVKRIRDEQREEYMREVSNYRDGQS